MSRLTLTRYTAHLEDINSLKKHDFPSLDFLLARQFRHPVHQPVTPFPPEPDPKSHDQVDVCRYSIYGY